MRYRRFKLSGNFSGKLAEIIEKIRAKIGQKQGKNRSKWGKNSVFLGVFRVVFSRKTEKRAVFDAFFAKIFDKNSLFFHKNYKI